MVVASTLVCVFVTCKLCLCFRDRCVVLNSGERVSVRLL